MNAKLKIPRGWYIARDGTGIHKGDKFMSSDGKTWFFTKDAGRIIRHGGIPGYIGNEQYAGIYIRKKQRATRRNRK